MLVFREDVSALQPFSVSKRCMILDTGTPLTRVRVCRLCLLRWVLGEMADAPPDTPQGARRGGSVVDCTVRRLISFRAGFLPRLCSGVGFLVTRREGRDARSSYMIHLLRWYCRAVVCVCARVPAPELDERAILRFGL